MYLRSTSVSLGSPFLTSAASRHGITCAQAVQRHHTKESRSAQEGRHMPHTTLVTNVAPCTMRRGDNSTTFSATQVPPNHHPLISTLLSGTWVVGAANHPRGPTPPHTTL
jgi:hypothetical protein